MKKQLKIYRKYYPGFLEELRGISEGSGISEDNIFGKFIAQEDRKVYHDDKRACTVFGVKEGKRLFVGRNYDFPPIAEKVFETFETKNPKAFSFVGVTDMGVPFDANMKGGVSEETKKEVNKLIRYTPIDAINERGLFIGLTKAYHKDVSSGVFSTHIMKLITETCESVSDALKVFKKVPVANPQNFFIADSSGKMVVIEHASGKNFDVVNPSDDGVLIHTNHFLGKKFKNKDLVLDVAPAHNTFLRYYEALQKINIVKRNRDFSKKDIVGILNAKGSHCLETGENTSFIKTIWTLSMEMTGIDYDLLWDLTRSKKKKKIELDF
ncbi:carcinine hydrolase/isopenicillin-N N-acyltransferase family protein [Patescibacteria group bacterium]